MADRDTKTAQPGAASSLAFQGVTVIDVSAGRLVPDQTVVVTGNRIRASGKAAEVVIPPNAQIIDGRGRFLMPGLWDMHVHGPTPGGFDPATLQYFIAYGVTGVREMAGPLDEELSSRQEIAAGRLVGPRMIVTGRVLDGREDEHFRQAVATPAEARKVVDSLKTAGADFLKVYTELSRETYFAIAAEARRVGIPFAGHLPDSITASEASDSGQRSFDHLRVLRQSGCRKAVDTTMVTDEATCAALATVLIRNGTWFVPTLAPYYAASLVSNKLPELAEFGRGMTSDSKCFVPAGGTPLPRVPPSQAINVLHRAGVPIVTGTDVPTFGLVPGLSLHQELVLLVEGVGLTPAEALRAATLNPAKFLNATDSLGAIAPGKLADLVLLGADPLANIRNTLAICAVVANGRYFDRAALDTRLPELSESDGDGDSGGFKIAPERP